MDWKGWESGMTCWRVLELEEIKERGTVDGEGVQGRVERKRLSTRTF